MSRPQLTQSQLDIARAALAELDLLFLARLELNKSAVALMGIFDGYALPLPPALQSFNEFTDAGALAQGINEFAELIQRAQVVPAELPAVELAA